MKIGVSPFPICRGAAVFGRRRSITILSVVPVARVKDMAAALPSEQRSPIATKALLPLR